MKNEDVSDHRSYEDYLTMTVSQPLFGRLKGEIEKIYMVLFLLQGDFAGLLRYEPASFSSGYTNVFS